MSLPNRRAVIDDSDIRIRYDGAGWVQDISGGQDGTGTYGATYNHTLHTTKANGSLAFSFEGTSIQVYGTVNLSPTYNASIVSDPSFQPPWECFIDNISIGASKPSPFQENNWVFCENDHLNDGSHELKLNINMKQGTTFWLDYLQYTPSQTPENGLVVLVDNSDPSLSYDSTWQGVESTATMTTTQGGKVTFNFNGTQLTWIGVIPIDYPGNGSSASYSVDNGTPTSFDLVGHPATDGTSRYNQIFFTTPKLSPGSHNLSVTYNGNSQLTPLTLDYIYLTTSTSTSSSGPATTSPSSSSTSGHHTNVRFLVAEKITKASIVRSVHIWKQLDGRATRKRCLPATDINAFTK
ncbi:hypothetical protein H0H87_007254 [Tephrocybe sp. NHM501043]|nr:hypothetical protein H0H87_007254 [Tephrocybe sp. NHM501043]